jgi:hypothetical protein
MAVTNISLTKIPLNGGVAMPATLALNAADGGRVVFTEQDTKTVILLENTASGAASVVFKAGSGLQGVADMTVSVPGSTTMAYVVESGYFKRAGAVWLTGPATVKVAALVTP